jgi:hypothetical protein
LPGDLILKRWINFTGKDGTFSGEEAVAVAVGVGVVVSVVIVVIVMDPAVILHKVWDGLSNRFIKLSYSIALGLQQSAYGTLAGPDFLLIDPPVVEDDCQGQS